MSFDLEPEGGHAAGAVLGQQEVAAAGYVAEVKLHPIAAYRGLQQ